MTEMEHERFQEAMDQQAAALRQALAVDLGGEPADYSPGTIADKPE